MAILTNTLQRSSVIGVREELSDMISRITPVDVKFMSSIKKKSCSNTFFEWQTDSLGTPANNAQIDGDDASFTAVAQPTRVGNHTQISSKTFIISDTSNAVNRAGARSEKAREIAKQADALKRDMEFALWNNTTFSSSATRQTRGVQGWLATNCSFGAGGAAPVISTNTAPVAGTNRALTEALVKTQCQNIFSQGGSPNTLYVTPAHKMLFSGLTFNATRFQKAEGAALNAAVDVYINDFYELKVVPSRIMALGASNAIAAIIDHDQFALRTLRPYEVRDLAKTGDADKSQLIVEYGLECTNEAASAQIRDLTP
jgi:hypothetical protein